MGVSDFAKGENQSGENLLGSVSDELERLSKRSCIKLFFTERESLSPLESRLGGAPYIEKSTPYPTDSRGGKMTFLLQLNLKEIKAKSDLPQKGLLQFFISASGKNECKVLYYSEADEGAFKARKGATGGFSPVLKECAVSYRKGSDLICVNDGGFDALLTKAVKNVTGKRLKGSMYDSFTPAQCRRLSKKFTAKGSKLFGNPCFVQSDVRDGGKTLLLQLDSDGESIMWGDYGVGRFFISEEELKKQNFENVIFNWDCL